MTEAIMVALITAATTIIAQIIIHRKSVGLMEYRIDQLELKVMKHNNLIDRTYELEKECKVITQHIKDLHGE